jgi:osmotically-inducible protein OsmY
MRFKTLFLPGLALSVLVFASCTPVGVATGVGASLGVAASQEGGISRAAEDARIQVEINDLWFRSNVDMFSKLDLTINQGRVLITGVVQDPEHRVEAVRLAWQPKGVKQVINEIQVAKSAGITGYAKDTWITTRLRASMIFTKDIQSINYSIDTVQGTVYLMGFAQNQLELNRVTELARTINGVKSVVSYVKIVGGPDQYAPVQAQPGNYGDPQFTGTAYQQGQNYERNPAGSNDRGPVVLQPEPYKAPSPGHRQGIESEVLN